MDWFEEWFDSPLYEKLYANRDEEEAAQLIELLEETLSLQQCSKILDLGCGRGRHSINLSKKGYQVTGIDLSKQAIATAREKARAEGIDNIRFKVRDMRDPLPETFDAVVNLFTTFGYFKSDTENASVFDSVRQMLVPGGIFVLDYLNATRVRTAIRSSEEGSFHGIHYTIRRYIKDNAVFKEIEFSGDRIDGSKNYAERVKLYTRSWFEREMGKRNLTIDHTYGDYQGSDFDPESSDRLLIISHLKEGSVK
ncbi:Methyltransferase domain-containing protein [Fodinibius roseus]|uniref:Methyltransferase domain-containing protein n=1 Tax=Fodinibius roseus TaxID=1194090 RepID=A0A1M5CXL6_9BACT|nr:class I SAM-dependent methyltransferase [Fodinibius roseus]SHF59445.1 Methyltransferase domain-containing protein [Fodinibius roseus]